MSTLKSCLLIVLCGVVTSADAAIVLQKGKDETIRGVIVKRDSKEVVIRTLGANGKVESRTIPAADVEDVIATVDAKRLAELKPSNPEAYRLYAEELSDKRQDLEAREVGIRLFLIAAHLEPKKLGRGCLLGMTRLARSPAEERRFRAMVYLLDPAHDRSALQVPQHQQATTGDNKDKKPLVALLTVCELIRNAEKVRAKTTVSRPIVKQALTRFKKLMSYEELKQIAAPHCIFCKQGRIKCPTCKGRGRVKAGLCRDCRGRRWQTCRKCYGAYNQRWVTNQQRFQVLTLELAVLRSLGAQRLLKSVNAPTKGAGKVRSWSKVVHTKQTAPAPILSLRTITEFDPTLNTFRNGKWEK